jgi:mannose-6-phosphate isomerase-like protein (cupin superfamily)
MQIVHSDTVYRVPDGTPPDYDQNNPLLATMNLIESQRLAAGLHCYRQASLQYLFPFDDLELYGPSGGDADNLDPTRQDNKVDFQKQNVRNIRFADVRLVRGYATAGDWTGPFLRLSYRGGPDSRLSRAADHRLGADIRAWVKIGATATDQPVTVPYSEATDRYEIELWGHPDPATLKNDLDDRGRTALERGELLCRPDLVKGTANDFARAAVENRYLAEVAPDHALHPILPLRVETAWSDPGGQVWDNYGGANYRCVFGMTLRGWDNYLAVGTSPNPHGGIGFLEYRNLLSNYGRYAGSRMLGRFVPPWSFDAFGRKADGERWEDFLSVDYMDLHIVRPDAGIGLHRHRDNSEVFLMMQGHGLMVIGDWAEQPDRQRCLEVRSLRSGDMAMLRGGQLHGLINPTDEDLFLFMFGGYD